MIIDRGSSSFLTNIECYEKGRFISRVQADGVMLATPTGGCLRRGAKELGHGAKATAHSLRSGPAAAH